MILYTIYKICKICVSFAVKYIYKVFNANYYKTFRERESPSSTLKHFKTLYVYSTTKETHQSRLGEILENRIKKLKYMYTIVLNNQFCINTLNKLKVLMKSVQAVRQYVDKGSFLKMTSFSLENE